MKLNTKTISVNSLSVILTILVSASAKQRTQPIVKDDLGFCEPLTIDFLANLVNVGARNLLEFGAYSHPKNVRFDLYTRYNPERRQVLRTGDQNALLTSHFNNKWPVRYLIHGWNGHSRTCSNAAIKDAYMAAGDFNLFIVDWSDFALDINFFAVLAQSQTIGRQINAFSTFLHKKMGVQYRNIYLIGHSLGCHIAGMAGKLLKPNMYGVIYALDTSGPVNSDLPADQRLVASDALYVEAINTDISLMGTNRADIAHAAFYPNWGLGQPHCPNITTDRVPDFTCDHFGSLYYFAESVRNSKAFGAIKCKNYRSISKKRCSCGSKTCKAQFYMGGDPAIPKRGVFYVSTRKTPPFGYGANVHMLRPFIPTALRLKTLS